MLKLEELEQQIDYTNLPNNVGVIPDGNRRFAEKYGLSIKRAYEIGAENARSKHNLSLRLGIPGMSIYVLSEENTARSFDEIQQTYEVIEAQMRAVTEDDNIHKYEAGTHFFGNLELLPDPLQELARKLENDTKNYTKHFLNLCFPYNCYQELADMYNKMKSAGITEAEPEDIPNYLYTANQKFPNVDLIMRTGGRNRLSGFLPVQSGYAEIYSVDDLWPEFPDEGFVEGVLFFQNQERNFGK